MGGFTPSDDCLLSFESSRKVVRTLLHSSYTIRCESKKIKHSYNYLKDNIKVILRRFEKIEKGMLSNLKLFLTPDRTFRDAYIRDNQMLVFLMRRESKKIALEQKYDKACNSQVTGRHPINQWVINMWVDVAGDDVMYVGIPTSISTPSRIFCFDAYKQFLLINSYQNKLN